MKRWMVFLLAFGSALAVAQKKEAARPGIEQITFPDLQVIMHRDSGKVILVNLWATWCKPCREEMPALVRLRNAMPKKNFTLILLSADDADDLEHDVRPLLKKSGVNFTTYIVRDTYEPFVVGMNPEWHGALALPMTYIYNKNGALADWIVGSKQYEQFKDAVNKAMAD